MTYLITNNELDKCSSSKFCENCRNLVYGKAWRQKHFPTLVNHIGIDFTCPIGVKLAHKDKGFPFSIQQQYNFLCQRCENTSCSERFNFNKNENSCPQNKWYNHIDIVYPYFANDAEDSEELRYSLRSLKQIKEQVSIWIVGDLPSWLNTQNIHYIAHKKTQNNRYIDIATKINLAASDNRMGNYFLYMNDDLYFTNPTSAFFVGLPRYIADYTENIEQFKIRGQWQQINKDAYLKLAQKNYSNRDYSLHFSYLYQTNKFLQLVQDYNLHNTPYNSEALYFNLFDKKPLIYSNQLSRIQSKIFTLQDKKTTNKALILNNTKDFFKTIQPYLEEKFPLPSIYEK